MRRNIPDNAISGQPLSANWIEPCGEWARRIHIMLEKGCFQAARNLVDQAEEAAKGVPLKSLEEMLDEPVAELGLPERHLNSLEQIDIFTVRDLLNRTSEELLSIPSFGETMLEDVRNALRPYLR